MYRIRVVSDKYTNSKSKFRLVGLVRRGRRYLSEEETVRPRPGDNRYLGHPGLESGSVSPSDGQVHGNWLVTADSSGHRIIGRAVSICYLDLFWSGSDLC